MYVKLGVRFCWPRLLLLYVQEIGMQRFQNQYVCHRERGGRGVEINRLSLLVKPPSYVARLKYLGLRPVKCTKQEI